MYLIIHLGKKHTVNAPSMNGYILFDENGWRWSILKWNDQMDSNIILGILSFKGEQNMIQKITCIIL